MSTGRSSRVKGSAFEREVVAVLRANGHPHAERAYGAGRADDRGDIDGLPGFVIEAKACRALDLAGWMGEAVAEAANAGPGVVPVVVTKRRGKPAADAYAVLRLEDFAQLINERPPPRPDDLSRDGVSALDLFDLDTGFVGLADWLRSVAEYIGDVHVQLIRAGGGQYLPPAIFIALAQDFERRADEA